MNELIYIGVFILLLIFKLWWDYRAKNVKKRIINHELSALIDGTIYLVSGWFLLGWSVGGWLILVVGLRWLLFDIIFNMLNGWRWDHYGRSSGVDRFLIKMGKFHLAPKIGLILLGIILIILL